MKLAATQLNEKKGFDFTKRNKVSIWVSQHPYQDIPEAYFDETFSHKKERATNTWSDNFKLQYFEPDFMDTNGVQTGTVSIKKAAGECSFSSSYIEALLNKAKKMKLTSITWIVLLYENEYNVKRSGIDKDTYLTFVGAFDYDDNAENLLEDLSE
jgi:immunity protein 22 of polymorphic toxin system